MSETKKRECSQTMTHLIAGDYVAKAILFVKVKEGALPIC